MKGLEIGVCGWSIDRHDVARGIALAGTELELRAVQIGFFTEKAVSEADPDAIGRAAESAGVTLTSSFVAFEGEDYSSIARIAETGGFAWDEAYEKRLAVTRDVADLTARVGCPAVAVHVGTIPENPSSDLYSRLTKRVREVADLLADGNLRLHIETGREPARVLSAFIEAVDRQNVGVNFDCGNFVVYGTDDPVEAVAQLAGLIENVHLKDALRAAHPGIEYGRPTPMGQGDAHIARVVSELRTTGYGGALLIECSSSDAGLEAVRRAADYLRTLVR